MADDDPKDSPKANGQLPAASDRPLEIRADALPPSPYAATTITAVLPAQTYERLGTIELSDEQNDMLKAPTPDDEIDIRPDGLIYVSHYWIRRSLNKVFGAMGWSLIPGSPLTKRPNSNEFYQRWVLFVGGVYASEALSSREYFDNNPQMSIDDLSEAVKSDALRRCCKDLGIGLDAWNKRFAERWKREHAVEVLVATANRGNQRQWRRRDGDKLRFEIGEAGSPPEGRASSPPPPPPSGPAAPSTSGTALKPPPSPAASKTPAPSAVRPRPAVSGTALKPEIASAPRTAAPQPLKLHPRQEGLIFMHLRKVGLLTGSDFLPSIDFLLDRFGQLEDPGEEGRSPEERLQEIIRQLDGRMINDILKEIDGWEKPQ